MYRKTGKSTTTRRAPARAAPKRAATRAAPRRLSMRNNEPTNNTFSPLNPKPVYYRRPTTGYTMMRKPKTFIGSIFYKRNMTKAEALEAFDASRNENQTDAVPVVNSLGNFVPINVFDSFSLSTSTTLNKYIILQFTYNGISCITCDSGSSNATYRTFGALNTSVPATIRPSRMSICIGNLSNANTVTGQVQVLQIPNFLAYVFNNSPAPTNQFTDTFISSLSSLLDSNPQTKNYPASMFMTTRKFSLTPASYVNFCKFVDFDEWAGLDVASQQAQLNAAAEDMAQGTLIIRFPNSTASNVYTIQIYQQICARYPANTILSSVQRPGKTISAKQLQYITEMANKEMGTGLITMR